MATVIRRTSEVGDRRLPRAPFQEPGVQPTIRLSSLAFQGDNGDPAVSVQSPEGGYVFGPGGQGTDASYIIHETGVPAYDFDATLAGGSERNPTLYRISDSRPVALTFIAVIRVKRFPTAGAGVPSSQRDLHIVRSGTSDTNSLMIVAPSVENNGGKLAMRGGSGGYVFGPDFPSDGNLHFVACVRSGTTGRLYLDGTETVGTIGEGTGNLFTTGFSLNGAHWEIVEACQYSAALTKAQIAEKRAYHRALFQF